MVFATNIHIQSFLRTLIEHKERGNDNYFCASMHVYTCPWPFHPSEDFFESCLEEFKNIIQNGLPEDVRQYVESGKKDDG